MTTEEVKRIHNYLTEDNIRLLEQGDPIAARSNLFEIDRFMLRLSVDTALKVKILDYLSRKRQLMGRKYKVSNESLLIRFFRFTVLRLLDKNLVFDIKRGRPFNLRRSHKGGLKISVKDPFLEFENHGFWLKKEENLQKIVQRMKSFLKMASEGQIEDFIKKVKEVDYPKDDNGSIDGSNQDEA
jgi:hypothetical protein